MNRRFTLLALGAAGAGYLISNQDRRADSHSSSFMADSIEHKQNKLTLHWNGKGGFYRVYRGNQLVYSGAERSFSDHHLTPGTIYTYTIEEETKDEINIMKIQTATAPKEKNEDNILQNLIITTVIVKGKIRLYWEHIDGITEYTVFRNGTLVGKVKGNFFIDQRVRNNKEYTYTIKAMRPLISSEENISTGKFLLSELLGFLKKDTTQQQTAYEELRITKRIGRIDHLLKTKDTTGERFKSPLQLRYTTFLTKKWLKNPNPTSNSHYFRGDNRGFDAESQQFRTRADITVDMTKDEPAVKLTKQVGKTRAYNWRRKFREEGQGSDDNIQLEKVLNLEDHTVFQISHSVSNPLIVAPAIDYDLQASFYKDGVIDIAGIHDQAPHHEVYLKSTQASSWQIIHQAQDKGLEMMGHPTANQLWRFSTME